MLTIPFQSARMVTLAQQKAWTLHGQNLTPTWSSADVYVQAQAHAHSDSLAQAGAQALILQADKWRQNLILKQSITKGMSILQVWVRL